MDLFLDACHQKALVLMRQLQYVESALLTGGIYPNGSSGQNNHLAGSLAADAEMILLDMI